MDFLCAKIQIGRVFHIHQHSFPQGDKDEMQQEKKEGRCVLEGSGRVKLLKTRKNVRGLCIETQPSWVVLVMMKLFDVSMAELSIFSLVTSHKVLLSPFHRKHILHKPTHNSVIWYCFEE